MSSFVRFSTCTVVGNVLVGLVPVETNVIVGLAFTCCGKCCRCLGFLPTVANVVVGLVFYLLKKMSSVTNSLTSVGLKTSPHSLILLLT